MSVAILICLYLIMAFGMVLLIDQFVAFVYRGNTKPRRTPALARPNSGSNRERL